MDILVLRPRILYARIALRLFRRRIIERNVVTRTQIAPDPINPRVDFGIGKVDHAKAIGVQRAGERLLLLFKALQRLAFEHRRFDQRDAGEQPGRFGLRGCGRF